MNHQRSAFLRVHSGPVNFKIFDHPSSSVGYRNISLIIPLNGLLLSQTLPHYREINNYIKRPFKNICSSMLQIENIFSASCHFVILSPNKLFQWDSYSPSRLGHREPARRLHNSHVVELLPKIHCKFSFCKLFEWLWTMQVSHQMFP